MKIKHKIHAGVIYNIVNIKSKTEEKGSSKTKKKGSIHETKTKVQVREQKK